MFDGSSSGRAFETLGGIVVFGVVAVAVIGFWIWFQYDVGRKNTRDGRDDTEGDP